MQNGLIVVVSELGGEGLGLGVRNVGIVALFRNNVEIMLGDLEIPQGNVIFVQDRLGTGGCCLSFAEGCFFAGIDSAC